MVIHRCYRPKTTVDQYTKRVFIESIFGRNVRCVVINAINRKGHFCFISQPAQSDPPMNKYQVIAALHTGQVLQSAHGGAAFLPWHRIYLLL